MDNQDSTSAIDDVQSTDVSMDIVTIILLTLFLLAKGGISPYMSVTWRILCYALYIGYAMHRLCYVTGVVTVVDSPIIKTTGVVTVVDSPITGSDHRLDVARSDNFHQSVLTDHQLEVDGVIYRELKTLNRVVIQVYLQITNN